MRFVSSMKRFIRSAIDYVRRTRIFVQRCGQQSNDYGTRGKHREVVALANVASGMVRWELFDTILATSSVSSVGGRYE